MFDPDAYLNMQSTEANATDFIPVPVGEFTAVSSDIKCRTWQGKKDPSQSGLCLDVTWEIDDQGVKEIVGRDKVTVRQSIMLDMTDSGGLDFGKGKNVHLGRLRSAVGLNEPGQPFSFNMLAGRVAKIKIKHSIYNNAPQAEVDAVAKA